MKNRRNATEPNTTEAPKPMKERKHPRLWQAYQSWHELVELRKRHILRISSIERGASRYDAQYERDFIAQMALEAQIDNYRKEMIAYGKTVTVWPWVTSIRGLKEGSLATQLLAQIDDIAPFSNVSKLWRFCGQAVIGGKAEYGTKHYNRQLKSICYLISDQFVKQNTPIYRDLYDMEKARQREAHPEPLKADDGPWAMQYTPAHIDAMARRKAVKIFLQHLWLVWREAEDLPTNEPYAIAQLQHADYVLPPVVEEAA